tara:strand:- start:169 stop:399 length:231 start_codon:yes stop_codon:yes gene_type:complete
MKKNISDHIRVCYCGAWNSPFRTTCGDCGRKLIIKMSGLEIIERLKKIKTQISDKDAIQRIDYLIDDIFMYKNNSL